MTWPATQGAPRSTTCADRLHGCAVGPTDNAMSRHTVSVILLALLCLLQVQLWHGRGSLPDVQRLRQQIEDRQAQNDRAKFINERLNAEIRDLQQGLDMVESKARSELGMVKPNEIFVQISK